MLAVHKASFVQLEPDYFQGKTKSAYDTENFHSQNSPGL